MTRSPPDRPLMDPSTLTIAAARDHGCDQHGYGEDDGRPYDHEMAVRGWACAFRYSIPVWVAIGALIAWCFR